MTPRLSAVLVARDEAEMLPGCLDRLGFVDEVVVLVDERTTDDTAAIARRAGAVVEVAPFTTFGTFRNRALDLATGEWVLIIDPDERVSGPLAREITAALDRAETGWRVRIENWFFGYRVKRSGYRERSLRLWRRELARYAGDIHELPRFEPGTERVGMLRNRLVHFSHRTLAQHLAKAPLYAELQAREMHHDGQAAVTRWSLLRITGVEFGKRFLAGQAWRDGVPGIIESLFQPFALFLAHARLWELQQEHDTDERYRRAEEAIPR